MKAKESNIVFVDNTAHTVLKTLEHLKKTFGRISLFTQEKDLFNYLEKNSADVILLNLDFYPNDALSLLNKIRLQHPRSETFFIIYTEKQDDFVQELAYNAGVDSLINFHNKPSVVDHFLQNLLRRRTVVKSNQEREIVIDHEQYLVFLKGVAVQLPRKEFRLFELLYNNKGKFISKHDIAERIWKDAGVARKRTIDVHIYNIRRFFGKAVVESKKGKGYRFNKRPAASG